MSCHLGKVFANHWSCWAFQRWSYEAAAICGSFCIRNGRMNHVEYIGGVISDLFWQDLVWELILSWLFVSFYMEANVLIGVCVCSEPYADPYYDYEMEALWRGGQYENFRVQYTEAPLPYHFNVSSITLHLCDRSSWASSSPCLIWKSLNLLWIYLEKVKLLLCSYWFI